MEHSPDWSLIEPFLAVSETGSLSAAASALGRSQPTLGRQIAALEAALNTPLFARHARGLRLTPEGEALLPDALAMRDAMGRLTLRAAGGAADLTGTVRLTASEVVSHYILPPILAKLRAETPEIRIELVPSDTLENLLYREADIAIRMARPTQLDLTIRQVGSLPIGIFAARDYLDRNGRPDRPEDLMTLDLIGYDRNDLILRGMADMGFPVTREDFAIRCDSQTAYWELLRAGCGIGFVPVPVGKLSPGVERLFAGQIDIPPLPIWLTSPSAIRHTPRIDRVWRALDAGLSGIRAA